MIYLSGQTGRQGAARFLLAWSLLGTAGFLHGNAPPAKACRIEPVRDDKHAPSITCHCSACAKGVGGDQPQTSSKTSGDDCDRQLDLHQITPSTTGPSGGCVPKVCIPHEGRPPAKTPPCVQTPPEAPEPSSVIVLLCLAGALVWWARRTRVDDRSAHPAAG